MQGAIGPVRQFVIGVLAVTAAVGVGSAVFAHDDIESSVPEHQSQFDEPISEVVINFGEPVDGVELALVGPDDGDLPGEVVVISDTEAKLVFEPLATEGEYLVRYLAEEDGHLVGGAISFVYGDRAGESAGALTWVLFGLGAVLVLAIGAYFSLRRNQMLALDGEDADGELADTEA
jgi:methionine-rich copper-binding protein CopC